jgi:hypothetical protein
MKYITEGFPENIILDWRFVMAFNVCGYAKLPEAQRRAIWV